MVFPGACTCVHDLSFARDAYIEELLLYVGRGSCTLLSPHKC